MECVVDDIRLDQIRKLKSLLICKQCNRLPRPGVDLYRCSSPQKCVLCIDCIRHYNNQRKNPGCLSCPFNVAYGYYGEHGSGYSAIKDVIITSFASVYNHHFCKFTLNGCKEELHVKDLKRHEDACIYQKVPCPLLHCKEDVIFNDVQLHIQMNHSTREYDQVVKFSDEPKNLDFQSVTAYNHQFYVQFNITEKHLYVRPIMLGHLEENLHFKMAIDFELEDEKHMKMQTNVYPIKMNTKTTLDVSDKFTVVSLNDLTEFYDYKVKEFKNSKKVSFTLKIINSKLDEIARDADVESGVEDTDNEN